MVMALGLLAILFLCGLLNTFFKIPPKLFVWIQSFLPNTSSILSTTTTTIATTNTLVSNKEEKDGQEKVVKAKKEKEKEKEKEMKSGKDKIKLERVFATFDKNGDGFITKQELGESLKNMGLFTIEKEVGDMVKKLDTNGDGLIDLDEFCELYDSTVRGQYERENRGEEEEEDGDLREVFDVYDGNRDGFITVEELEKVLSSLGLKQGMRMEDCREMIRKFDLDGDGMVNFDEFKQMMQA